MISIQIPGLGHVQFTHLLLDVNGTLSVDGALQAGVVERLGELSEQLSIFLVTADTRGTAGEIARELGVDWVKLRRGQEAEQKRRHVESYGAEHVIAIGNGNNDTLMLAAAGLGIAVLGAEGTSVRTLLEADVVTRDIDEALDLLLEPKRLLGTLRC